MRPLSVIGCALAALTALAAVTAGSPAREVLAEEPKAFTVPGTRKWNHGDPSGDEQHLLELINRARMDPAAEGLRIFNDYNSSSVTTLVNSFAAVTPGTWSRAENRDAWATYARRPPLAYNRQLSVVAREWSNTMRTKGQVAQTFTDRLPVFQRIQQQGYCVFWATQLLNGFAPDMVAAHAAWTIDWGQPIDPATNRAGLPNRIAIINWPNTSAFRHVEAGLGIVTVPNPQPGALGPHIVTGTFTVPCDPDRRYAVGVCYEDKNANGEYDAGEGLPNVRIDVDQSEWFATTSASGGYAVPIHRLWGQVTIAASGQAGTSSQIFPSRGKTASTFDFDINGGNVKADFVLPPRGDPPVATVVDGAVGTVAQGLSNTFGAIMPPLPGERTDLGAIDVAVDIAHPDRSRLRVKLINPAGTEVTLWESGAPGTDLIGTFDSSLRSLEPLETFVGEEYAGQWTLHVEDSGAGDAVVNSWSMNIRPGWVAPLDAPRTHLFVAKLKIKNRKKTGKDGLSLKLDIDTGQPLPVDAGSNLWLALRRAEDDTEWLVADLANETVTIDGTPQPSAVFKTTFNHSHKATSRAKLNVSMNALELSGAPRDMRVELRAGDAVVAQDVRVANGGFNGKRGAPLVRALRVERIKSRPKIASRRTTISGRYKMRGINPIPAVLEVRVGQSSAIYRSPPLRLEERRIEYGRQGNIKRVILDPVTGRFTIKLDGQHAIVADGSTIVSLWTGDFFGEAVVQPVQNGDKYDY